MTPLALRLLTILALFLPAASEAMRLILANGDKVSDVTIVSATIPQNGLIVIVPDVIYAAPFELAAPSYVRPTPRDNDANGQRYGKAVGQPLIRIGHSGPTDE